MVEAADIHDDESLKAWLDDQPSEVAVWIATRAALRVGPILWNETAPAKKVDLKSIFFLRSLLILGVLGTTPTNAIRSAAIASASSVSGIVFNSAAFDPESNTAFSAVFGSVFAADSAAATAAASTAARVRSATYIVAAAAVSSASRASPIDIWPDVTADAVLVVDAEVPTASTLWNRKNPIESGEWQDVLIKWQESGAGWQFWIDWYEAILAGRQINPKMLEDIALIDGEDWDKGADHVNEIIAAIVGKYRLDRVIADNPYALRVKLDEKRKKLSAHAVDSVDASQASATARQAMKDFTGRCRADKSPNGMLQILGAACDDAIKDLRRDLRRYPDNVVALYDALMSAQRALHQAAAANGMERAGPILSLTGTLDNSAKDLAGSSPALLETLHRRSTVDLARARNEQIAMMVRLCNGMKQDSEGYLEIACQIAITAMLSSETQESEKQSAWLFMQRMLPQGAKAILAAQEDDSPPSTRASVAKHVKDGTEILTSVDKSVDALQEAVTEFGPWTAEFLTQLGNGNIPT